LGWATHNIYMAPLFTAEQQRFLLMLARQALAAHLGGEDVMRVPDEDPVLQVVRGVFVTLHEGGQLRGCIGQVEAEHPLPALVSKMAIAAATRDPRFSPVTADELAVLHIELSVLSPPQAITDLELIEVGRHGLQISYGSRRGILLPQVPKEWGWDRLEFIENACRKAGLPAEAYRDIETEIAIFTAQVFGEPASALI